jgi:hypothetical protein
MSGSGGGGGGGRGGFPGDSVSCENLVIHTQLTSPVPALVANLHSGAVLSVEAMPGPITTLVVAKLQGQVVGGLAAAQIIRLIDCIAAGTAYKATVTAVAGGQVKVRVEAV